MSTTLEQRIRIMIGDLMINNASLMAQIELLQTENAELKAKTEAPPPAKKK